MTTVLPGLQMKKKVDNFNLIMQDIKSHRKYNTGVGLYNFTAEFKNK